MGELTLGSIGDGCCLKGWDGSIGVMGAAVGLVSKPVSNSRH